MLVIIIWNIPSPTMYQAEGEVQRQKAHVEELETKAKALEAQGKEAAQKITNLDRQHTQLVC